jgi:glycosyltransferase involved in cell wall biosynthesis
MERDASNNPTPRPISVACVTSQAASITNVRPEAEWFIGLSRSGIDMTVMTEQDSVYADRMRAAGVRVVHLDIRGKYEWRTITRIRAELHENRHDVLHLFNNKAIYNGIVAALGLPPKVVAYRGQTGNIKRYDPTCYLTHLNPRVDKITCVADAVRLDLIDNGVNPDKLVTIYKGHDLAWYDGIVADDLAAFGIPDNAFTVALVANNRPRKGVSVLIDSAQYLPTDSAVHFLLIGSGMTGDDVRRRIAAGPLASHFHLVDFRDDVLPLVAACDAGVLPSTKREGLPKTVIEAMALGLPAVVTRTGGSPELVVDGECGYVVEPNEPRALANALQALAADRDRARRMGTAARERIGTRFNVEQGVAAHAQLYAELARRPRRA